MKDTKVKLLYVCFDCALLLLRVTFSRLEIKNVHSHKLEMTLVLPFYSKDELHIPHEAWNELIKLYKSHMIVTMQCFTNANRHHRQLVLT